MPSLYIKNIPEDLYQKLEEMAKATGRSKQDIIIEALQLRIYGQQVNPDSEMVEYTEPKLRPLYFPTKCAKCGKTIPAGEEAWLAKVKYKDGSERWIAWHFSCLMTDKQLAKIYLEIRKLRKIRDTLKKEADELADLIIEAQARKKVLDIALEIQKVSQELEKKVFEISDRIREWLFTVDAKNEDLKAIREELYKINEEYQNRLDELKRKLEDVAAAFVQPKVKRSRKKKAEESWIWR